MRLSSMHAAGSVSARRIRRAARIVGVSAATLWILIGVLGAIAAEETDSIVESLLLATFVLIAAGGVVFAFYREVVGGSVVLAAGIALTVFALVTASRNQWMAVLVSGAPFVIAGALFLVAWSRNRNGTGGAVNGPE